VKSDCDPPFKANDPKTREKIIASPTAYWEPTEPATIGLNALQIAERPVLSRCFGYVVIEVEKIVTRFG
jgi:hypothetical protein